MSAIDKFLFFTTEDTEFLHRVHGGTPGSFVILSLCSLWLIYFYEFNFNITIINFVPLQADSWTACPASAGFCSLPGFLGLIPLIPSPIEKGRVLLGHLCKSKLHNYHIIFIPLFIMIEDSEEGKRWVFNKKSEGCASVAFRLRRRGREGASDTLILPRLQIFHLPLHQQLLYHH